MWYRLLSGSYELFSQQYYSLLSFSICLQYWRDSNPRSSRRQRVALSQLSYSTIYTSLETFRCSVNPSRSAGGTRTRVFSLWDWRVNHLLLPRYRWGFLCRTTLNWYFLSANISKNLFRFVVSNTSKVRNFFGNTIFKHKKTRLFLSRA